MIKVFFGSFFKTVTKLTIYLGHCVFYLCLKAKIILVGF